MSTEFTIKGYLQDKLFNNLKAPIVKPFKELAALLKRAPGATSGEYHIPEHTPIGSQGGAGTCVANAFCDGVEILLGVEHGASAVVQLSRRHLYWISRYTHKATDVDSGTYLRAAAWQLQEIGVMPEQYFPYSDKLSALTTSPPLNSYTMASENRVTGHFRIMSLGQARLDEIEEAVRANHPVAFGTDVTQKFKEADGKSVLRPETKNILGGHAMLVVGVRKSGARRQFLWRNSWSTRWGNYGRCWVDEDFMTWRKTSDIWVLTRMQNID